jgi:hypothetical protein
MPPHHRGEGGHGDVKKGVYYKEIIIKLSPRYKLRRILIIYKLIIGLLISRFLSNCIFVKKNLIDLENYVT